MFFRAFERLNKIKTTAGFLACASILGAGGCVERSITIVTDPPGSVVYLNDVEQGSTPCTVPFEWYGDYDVRIRAQKEVGTPDNPKTIYYYLHTNRTAHTPWFQVIPIDFFADIAPWEIRDDKTWAFVVPEVPDQSSEELIQNARSLKGQLQAPPQTQP